MPKWPQPFSFYYWRSQWLATLYEALLAYTINMTSVLVVEIPYNVHPNTAPVPRSLDQPHCSCADLEGGKPKGVSSNWEGHVESAIASPSGINVSVLRICFLLLFYYYLNKILVFHNVHHKNCMNNLIYQTCIPM